MSFAWDNDKIIRVDMTELSISIDMFPAEWQLLGGRALSARILLNECNPKCVPLGPENVLVLAPGVMSGTSAPTSGRLSVGCKSPLTGGIKEANTGGNAGQDLMKLGYRAVVVKGQPTNMERRWGLEVTEHGVRIVEADAYKGMFNYASCEKLFRNYPESASAISIGPAGEKMLKGASVATTDRDKARRPARHAARGGVGAVMGSKCLKWVLVDPGAAPLRRAANPKEFAQYMKSFSKEYLGGRHEMIKYGTSATVPVANMMHTLPHKNRTSGRNPEVENLDGARIRESFESRGGGMHNCMNGCIVRCSNIVHDASGNYVTSALEFETLAMLGSCCDINNWEDVAELDRLCDEVGLDTIETGAAIAVLMDSGGMTWGDAAGVKSLLREGIANGVADALLIANGAKTVGEARCHHRTPIAKGQAIPAWDPRPLKAVGITYCTSAQGADHTAGLVMNPDLDGRDAAIASQEIQIINAVCDLSGFCMFLLPSITEVAAFLSKFYGREITREVVGELGWQCLVDEWEFNRRAGFTDSDDTMAACLREEGIGPNNSLKFDVSAETIALAKVRQPLTEELYTKSPAG